MEYYLSSNPGKTTNALLEKLGGNRVFEYGEGDDNESIEDDFVAWRAKLWTELVKRYHPDGKSQAIIDIPRANDDREEKKVELTFNLNVVEGGRSLPLPSNHFSNAEVRQFEIAVVGIILTRF